MYATKLVPLYAKIYQAWSKETVLDFLVFQTELVLLFNAQVSTFINTIIRHNIQKYPRTCCSEVKQQNIYELEDTNLICLSPILCNKFLAVIAAQETVVSVSMSVRMSHSFKKVLYYLMLRTMIKMYNNRKNVT